MTNKTTNPGQNYPQHFDNTEKESSLKLTRRGRIAAKTGVVLVAGLAVTGVGYGAHNAWSPDFSQKQMEEEFPKKEVFVEPFDTPAEVVNKVNEGLKPSEYSLLKSYVKEQAHGGDGVLDPSQTVEVPVIPGHEVPEPPVNTAIER